MLEWTNRVHRAQREIDGEKKENIKNWNEIWEEMKRIQRRKITNIENRQVRLNAQQIEISEEENQARTWRDTMGSSSPHSEASEQPLKELRPPANSYLLSLALGLPALCKSPKDLSSLFVTSIVTSEETLTQNHPAKPLPNSWSQTLRENKCLSF